MKTKLCELTKRQEKALYSALRTLDIRNDYETGDELRRAFKIELDVAKYHKQNGYYDEH